MKRLPLIISYSLSDPETIDIARKIHKVILNEINLEEAGDHLIAVLERYGAEVRELVMRRMQIEADNFCAILRLLPQLRKISLDFIGFNYFDEIQENQIQDTKHLTHVVLSECHPAVSEVLVNLLIVMNFSQILGFFDVSKVVSLKQSNFSDALISKQLPALQQLYLRRKNEGVEKETVPIVSPQLKRLSIGVAGEIAVMSILEQVKDSVEELEMVEVASPQIFEYIFKNFTKLRQLELDMDQIPAIDLSNLRTMPHVTQLILHSSHPYYQLLEPDYSFVGHLPNIETLVVDVSDFKIEPDGSSAFMAFVSLNLPKLKTLELRNLGDLTFKDVCIPSLRALLIHEITVGGEGLKSMTQCCSNIEKLAIESPYDFSSLLNPLILDVAYDLKKLQQIYLGDGFTATDLTLSYVWKNLPDLKKFTIMDTAVKEDPTLVGKFPLVVVATKLVKFSKIVDSTAGEDIHIVSSFEDEYYQEFGSDFDDINADLDEADDEFVRYDDLEDWQPGDDDDNSDDDYTGYARPG